MVRHNRNDHVLTDRKRDSNILDAKILFLEGLTVIPDRCLVAETYGETIGN
jgi:hypothetical protein